MDSIEKLLDLKMLELENVLLMTKETSLTDDEEVNCETLVELIDRRETSFSIIRDIDNKILALDKDATLVNNTIISLKNQLIDLDKQLQPDLIRVKMYLQGKVKGVKQGKQITNKLKTNLFDEGNRFNMKG